MEKHCAVNVKPMAITKLQILSYSYSDCRFIRDFDKDKFGEEGVETKLLHLDSLTFSSWLL